MHPHISSHLDGYGKLYKMQLDTPGPITVTNKPGVNPLINVWSIATPKRLSILRFDSPLVISKFCFRSISFSVLSDAFKDIMKMRSFQQTVKIH